MDEHHEDLSLWFIKALVAVSIGGPVLRAVASKVVTTWKEG